MTTAWSPGPHLVQVITQHRAELAGAPPTRHGTAEQQPCGSSACEPPSQRAASSCQAVSHCNSLRRSGAEAPGGSAGHVRLQRKSRFSSTASEWLTARSHGFDRMPGAVGETIKAQAGPSRVGARRPSLAPATACVLAPCALACSRYECEFAKHVSHVHVHVRSSRTQATKEKRQVGTVSVQLHPNLGQPATKTASGVVLSGCAPAREAVPAGAARRKGLLGHHDTCTQGSMARAIGQHRRTCQWAEGAQKAHPGTLWLKRHIPGSATVYRTGSPAPRRASQ